MNTLFDNKENSDKINLDSLYDKKREIDLMRISVYNKVLHRIHDKIKYTARQKYNEQFIFYIFPEFMIGVPRYNVNHCIIYVIEKLEKNGFVTKYTHPNMLFVSWSHYIPKYKRDEIKLKHGISIDGFGNKIKERQLIKNTPESKKTTYKDISSYKPKGIFK